MSITGLSHYLSQNPILILLLICHLLSDFQLQNQTVADRKSTGKTYPLIHLIWVAVPLILVAIFIPSIWGINLLILLSHSIVDSGRPHVASSFELNPLVAFLLDQMLYLGIILLLVLLARGVLPLNFLTGEALNIILLIVLVTKPINVIFKIFPQECQPENSQKTDTTPGAGATIELLERIVISICIIFNQFVLIGLVFTVKLIARCNKISESLAFTEYYLIGSLFSILNALLSV